MAETPRFLVDAMLGNVVRDLRLLGYDAAYAGRRSDAEVLRLAQAQGRTLVTRDRALARRARGVPCVTIESEGRERRVVEVLAAVAAPGEPPGPLSRCLECNHPLEELPREDAWARVPDHVALTHRRFRECPGCGRVYWEGTHRGRLEQRISRICQSLHADAPHV